MLYAIIDVETTGGSPKNSKITEIAIFKSNGIEVVDSYSSLVHPEQSIPDFIIRLTGISNAMVETAPRFYEIAKEVIEFTKDCIFVAHNVSFDYGMIRNEFRLLGYDFRLPQMCTIKASRKIIPGYKSYSLGSLSKALNIDIKERHRAGGDAEATTALFHLLYNKSKDQLNEFIQHELNPKIINSNFDLDLLDEIPNKTGVYLFFNEYNQIIYIGKSIHIKSRIEQHLRNTKTAKSTQMIKDIARVEYEITGSELIAMLKESELIKEKKPLYNRKLRKSIFPYGVYDIPNEKGYLELKIYKIESLKANPIQYFNTKKEANDYLNYIVEKYELCQKLCSIYNSKSSCFHFSIQKCNGACVEQEPPAEYNLRVQKFIDNVNIDSNSFFIIDKGRNKMERSLIWIEQGKYKGFGFAPFHFNGDKNVHSYKRYIKNCQEDKDSKMIIKSFLKKENNSKLVYL